MSFEHKHCPCTAEDVPSMEIEVLLADRRALARVESRRKLEQDPTLRVSAEVEALSSLKAVVRAVSPAVIVAGVDLFEPTDLDMMADSAVPVLLIGNMEDNDRVARMLSPGVRGFICRSSPGNHWVDAVRAVAAGHASLPPKVTGKLLDTLVRTKPAPAVFDSLTDRERDVLQYIAQGMTTAELAAEMVVQISTIKSHIYHLLQKLKVKDRTQAVALAYQSGIVRLPEQPTAREPVVGR